MEASSSSTTTIKAHPVVLRTRTEYVIPSEQYMIPTTWRRFHLSQLINKVLALPQPIPFDFLVQGEMLRTTLGEWCTGKEIEEEETLEIEYIESVRPPERVSSMPHPDWVSSISCQMKGYFLTGSYDSSVRLYNESQELVYTIHGHSAPVSSVCVLGSTGADDRQLIASGSYDTTARLISVPLGMQDPETPQEPTTLASLSLHTAAVSSVAASSSGKLLLTGGWDSMIGVWNMDIPEADEVDDVVYPTVEDRRKKRKVKRDANAPVKKAPQSVLKSHTSRISAVRWSPLEAEQNTAFSCGWDFTVRTWDVEAGICTTTQTAPEKAMLDLALTCNGRTIATANGDRTVSLFQVDSSAPPSQLPHISPVTSISAHPTSQHHLAAGCMDGTVRIWDLRSPQGAVESFVAAGDQQQTGTLQQRSKVLSVDWSRGNLIGCAGELGIDIFRTNIGN